MVDRSHVLLRWTNRQEERTPSIGRVERTYLLRSHRRGQPNTGKQQRKTTRRERGDRPGRAKAWRMRNLERPREEEVREGGDIRRPVHDVKSKGETLSKPLSL